MNLADHLDILINLAVLAVGAIWFVAKIKGVTDVLSEKLASMSKSMDDGMRRIESRQEKLEDRLGRLEVIVASRGGSCEKPADL